MMYNDHEPPPNWRARYETLREVYRQEHPRITVEAIDAFIDGRVAGEGVGAGPEECPTGTEPNS
jgi:hypothetical protein